MKLQYLLLSLVCVFGTCGPKSVQVPKTNQSSDAADTKLIELVRLFSEDVGERGQKAFQEIRSHQNAVDELVALRGRLPPNDGLQPQIAFALLKLGHEHESNAAIISSALSKEPKFKDFDADQAASLLVRLIHDGDEKPLSDILRSAGWADGALAEIVGDEASDQLLSDTTRVLTILSVEPRPLRMKIYDLINGSGSLDQQDKKLIESRLKKINSGSPLFAVARELRASSALR